MDPEAPSRHNIWHTRSYVPEATPGESVPHPDLLEGMIACISSHAVMRLRLGFTWKHYIEWMTGSWRHICWYCFKVETLSIVEKFLQDHYSLCERLSTETSRVSGSPAWWQRCRSVGAAVKGSWSSSGKHFERSLQRARSIKYFRWIMWRRKSRMSLPIHHYNPTSQLSIMFIFAST